MKYYIDEKRVVQAIHEDTVVLPETVYPHWTPVQMENGYQLGDTLPEKTMTMDDYDAAMEDYIKSVRVARGYTLREPDCYINSRNEKRAQDAADFIVFRDAVMDYATVVREEYRKTGTVPSLEDFKAGLPQIEWTVP